MSRNTAILIAFAALTTSSAGICSAKAEHVMKRANAHVTHVADKKRGDSSSTASKAVQTAALTPSEAEVGSWRMKVADAGPASQVTQEAALREPEPQGNLNVYGMLIAALGLGGMSIVRRMGGL